MNRRRFLSGAATALAMGTIDGDGVPAAPAAVPTCTDVNVTLGRWPTRSLLAEDPAALVRKLRGHGVAEAWVGSFEGLLHKDLGAVNRRLAAWCREWGRGLLQAFGSIDPTRPDWEEEVRRCDEVHRMTGIRLHPNYHGYRLDHPAFAALLEQAARRRWMVQIAIVMEDERMMHPLMRVEPVDPSPLPSILRSIPGARVVLLNALRTVRAKPLLDLMATGAVWVDVAMIEGVGGVRQVLDQIPADRLLFGSHAPLFYWEAAQLKLRESLLTPGELESILRGTARALREWS